MSEMYLAGQAYDAQAEADKARAKFGEQLHLNDLEWQSILLEEVGEAAMLVTKMGVRPVTDPDILPEQLREEVVQVAAVALRWVAAIDHRIANPHPYVSRPGVTGRDQLG